jgi:CubicO group peptidase (beta-lactamase class C family)
VEAKANHLLKLAVDEGAVPGVVACTTDRSGATYEGGFGKRVLDQPADMTPDTVVWIASMTKAITGAAAMQQIERGKLNLDAPAKSVVPYLGEVDVLEGFDAAGKPKTRKSRRDITLRHLLTHTAGFSYEIFSDDIREYQRVMGLPDINSCENKALTTPLLFDPGDRWDYGPNIDWVGKMVEAASGQKLSQYFRDNVLGPLDMDDTAFFITPAMRERLAKVHVRDSDGSLSPDLAFEVPQQPEFEAGGHGLYGTARDYLKFVRMMLNEGKSDRGEAILKPETVTQMSTNAMGTSTVTPLRTAIPSLSNDTEFFPGIEKQWGLSFMINNEEAPTGRSAGSLAWAGLANTYYWIDQRKGVGGVYATQILPFADQKALPLFYAFEKIAYGKDA